MSEKKEDMGIRERVEGLLAQVRAKMSRHDNPYWEAFREGQADFGERILALNSAPVEPPALAGPQYVPCSECMSMLDVHQEGIVHAVCAAALCAQARERSAVEPPALASPPRILPSGYCPTCLYMSCQTDADHLNYCGKCGGKMIRHKEEGATP